MIIQDKVAFVTGGAQGIGRAICKALLTKGAKVIIADINVTEGKSTASEFATEYADNVTFIECDVTNQESVEGIMPFFACPSYCASKYGIVGFTRSIAMSPDFDLHKVRMNCLCPDMVDTPMISRFSKEGEKKGFIIHYDHVKDAVKQPPLKPPAVADVFIDLVEDESKNGAALLIPRKGPPRDIEFPVYQ
ncbi:15-hydroxyprostaglandin dehydrogenase [NAD(+)]-like [Lingula anatina]|uniref:15-hydroxyprostaglandin dehydrogenase [NAD(+)] n=1 Tax=Lingula anatina TaxID=7574 RepID=A0A1S3KHL9_LINAN|nr:15-hydroxyprostaglandin dehydrogenase [NAD(+)]-like [Lingula anatina]|eukprot:XP_013422123.1 15-hydroxyprostaglandin dehydrogenase [NAD(+)]-like [Lingula anatina]